MIYYFWKNFDMIHVFVSELFPTWRHSCSSWGLRSELLAVTERTDRPPSLLQWATVLSSRSRCCGWWTRPSEPIQQRQQQTLQWIYGAGTIWSREHLQKDVHVLWVRKGTSVVRTVLLMTLGHSSGTLTYCWLDNITCCAFISENSNTGIKEHYPIVHLISKYINYRNT